LYDNQMLIDVGQLDVFFGRWQRERMNPEFNDVAGPHFAFFIEAEIAVDLHAAARDEFANC
jgi:hypothetical protein